MNRPVPRALHAVAARWRLPVYGLLLYLPLSGLPILALYPETAAPVLAKDFVFVIPAYLAFLAYAYVERVRIPFPGAPVAAVVMLAALVLLQALNPALPNRLVAAIGIKVWLFYVPLLFIAYHFVRTRRDLAVVLGVISLGAVIPAGIGLIEAALFRAGQSDFVYRLYGDAASVTTQNFAALELPSGGVLRRVPSIFSSWTQYYAFVMSMVAITYAWWRGVLTGSRFRVLGAALWVVTLAAAFTSGARVAFVVIPVLVILTALLEAMGRERGSVSRFAPAGVVAPVAALLIAVSLLGLTAGDLVSETASKARLEFTGTFLDRFRDATEITWTGLGTGLDTIASRYAYSDQQLFPAVEGTWYESWFVKVELELGIPGLALVALLFGTIIVRGVRGHLALGDPRLRAVSAAILAFLVVNVLLAVTKPYLDLDPINVYFWFLAGVLAKLPALEP